MRSLAVLVAAVLAAACGNDDGGTLGPGAPGGGGAAGIAGGGPGGSGVGGSSGNAGTPIVPPYCGDGSCDAGEDCSSCATDCGSCPEPCTDTPPDDVYTCEEQAGWGKCAEPWMQGYCDASCGRCTPTGAGGTGGSVGGGGTGGSGAGINGCRPIFSSGVNLAWNEYGADVPDPDLAYFSNFFAAVATVGGTVARWWLHTNASITPSFDSSGVAMPITAAELQDVRDILDRAHAANVMVVVSLFSFDLQQDQWQVNLEYNRRLLQDDANRQAYIDNVLVPLVQALHDHPALHSWETFNEPEGMTDEFGWSTQTVVTMEDVQRNVNWFADAIHGVAPDALVTNGSWSFMSNTDVDGHFNYYTDQRLIAVGGRSLGTLDYYQVHYYDWGGTELSPFHHDAAHWQLDKPVVIGEFHVEDTFGVLAEDLYTTLHERGYAGAWGWAYIGEWGAIQVPMRQMLDTYRGEISYDSGRCL